MPRIPIRRPALILLPLLVLYGAIAALAAPDAPQGDESRYRAHAEALLDGRLGPEPGEVPWSGPGYPFFLAPWVRLGLPLAFLRFLNALLLYGATLYLFAAARVWLPERRALAFAAVAGLYPPFLYHLPFALAETAAVFLASAFAFHAIRAECSEVDARFHRYLAVVFLAGLALTKVLFGYVIASLAVVCAGMAIWQKSRRCVWLARVRIALLALLLCAPYLVGTYALSGRVFYWSTAGGLQAYWMTSPYPEDAGDWHSAERVERTPALYRNHGPFFASLQALPDRHAWDAALRQRAWANLCRHPEAFLGNWLRNVGRLFLGWPYSHRPKPWIEILAYAGPNLLLLAAGAWTLTRSIRKYGRMSREPVLPLLVAGLGLAGSSVLAAYGRMLTPLVPAFLLWIAAAYGRD